MRNAFTMIELLVILVIVGIMAANVLPMFTKAITRTEFKEVKVIVQSAISGAKNYDFKHDLQNLNVLGYQDTDQPRLWSALNIDLPDDTKCKYEIRMVGGPPAKRTLVVSTWDGSTWDVLYSYNFEDETGSMNEGNANKAYVVDLPGT